MYEINRNYKMKPVIPNSLIVFISLKHPKLLALSVESLNCKDFNSYQEINSIPSMDLKLIWTNV